MIVDTSALIAILRDEVNLVMGQIGCTSLAELDESFLLKPRS